MSRRMKLLFSSLTLLALLLVLEGAARLLLPMSGRGLWEHERNQIIETGFPALADILEPHPDLFWRLRADLTEVELSGSVYEYSTRFTVSTDGEHRRRMPPRPRASYRVVFMGDSCTFGLGVSDDETFPHLVQQRMKDVECLNLGCIGYSSYQGRKWLELARLNRPPDAVVITFAINDSLPWDNLGDVQHDVIMQRRNGWLARNSRLARLAQEARSVSLRSRQKRPRLTDDEFVRQITLMIEWCQRHDSRPILMIWPYEPQMRTPGFTSKQARLRKLGQRYGVPVMNLVTVFRQNGDSDLFCSEVHANARGCSLVAELLVHVLQRVLSETPGAPERAGRPPTRPAHPRP